MSFGSSKRVSGIFIFWVISDAFYSVGFEGIDPQSKSTRRFFALVSLHLAGLLLLNFTFVNEHIISTDQPERQVLTATRSFPAEHCCPNCYCSKGRDYINYLLKFDI